MLFKEVIAAYEYSENHTEHTNALWRETVEFF